MQAKTTYFSAITNGKIDRESGIISGVSAITGNVAAKGHGVFTDSKTLETALEVASEFSNGVKVKFRHKMSGEFQSVVDSTIGVIKNFSISGNKLIGDLHLLKSLSAEVKEKIFEMAEVMPDQFGLSIVFVGEYEELEGKKYLRCEDLLSIDLADAPAANPDGLFESKPTMSKEIKYKSGSSGAHHAECECGKCEDSEKMESMQTALNELTKLVKSLSEAKPVTSLSYKKDGKEISLSAEEIVSKLESSESLAKETAKTAETTLRKSIIDKMSLEGRVPMNPASKKAYTLEELNGLDLNTLQFASVNSAVIPLEAKAIYKGETKPKIDPALKGSDRIQAAWAEQYGDLETMKQKFAMAN